jgi:hypothetical protein
MPIDACCGRAAPRCAERIAPRLLLLAGLLLSGCAGAAAQRPDRVALPLDQAVAQLTDATLGRAELPPPGPDGRLPLVIDPLIDRATGAETVTTRSMEAEIAERVRTRHPRFALLPFTTESLERQPLVLLGAITGVQGEGSLANATAPGRPPAYRIWAVLADLGSGRVVAHETAWVQPDQVDPRPAGFHAAAPAWTADDAAASYLRTCALDRGDPIDPAYLGALRAQAMVADGTAAFEAGACDRALDLYGAARWIAPPDQQIRLRNGLYLANAALGKQREARAAFADIVDYGLERGRLGVKCVFRPGSAEFWPDPAVSGAYPMWLGTIAGQVETRGACLEIEGHSSPSGSPELNERLSLARAERLAGRLAALRPPLRSRLRVEGVGARETIVGTGADDASDVLDRRVEFEPMACRAPGR